MMSLLRILLFAGLLAQSVTCTRTATEPPPNAVVSPCTPGSNFGLNAVLRRTDSTIVSNEPILGDTVYLLDVTLNPPMSPAQVQVSLEAADGLESAECPDCQLDADTAVIIQPAPPAATSVTYRFRVRTLADKDLAEFLYFRVQTACQALNGQLIPGSSRVYFYPTNHRQL